MCSVVVVVREELLQQSPQVVLVQHDHVVESLAPAAPPPSAPHPHSATDSENWSVPVAPSLPEDAREPVRLQWERAILGSSAADGILARHKLFGSRKTADVVGSNPVAVRGFILYRIVA